MSLKDFLDRDKARHRTLVTAQVVPESGRCVMQDMHLLLSHQHRRAQSRLASRSHQRQPLPDLRRMRSTTTPTAGVLRFEQITLFNP